MLVRPHIREFLRICADLLPLRQPIVNVGARFSAGQERLADVRSLFPGKTYIPSDIIAGPGVERIESQDRLSFRDGEVGSFVSSDTLEHVSDLGSLVAELRRCLHPEQGIVVATSVMAFPIHLHPFDFWRFTPDGLRSLFAGFPECMIFAAGDRDFPHTVCVVAGAVGTIEPYRTQLVAALAHQRVRAPYITDGISRALIQRLASTVLAASPLANFRADATCCFTGALAYHGWVLIPGAWVQATIAELPRAGTYLLKGAGRTLMRIAADAINVRSHDSREVCFQFEPLDVVDGPACLELEHVSEDGRKACLARSVGGVLLASLATDPGIFLCEPGFPDTRPELISTERTKGDALIAQLRSAGESVVVDLGCGFRKRGTIGIDARRAGTDADLICLLGIDALPLGDAVADEVICTDFLEHLPKAVYLESGRRYHYPILYLIDEIWRVLKPGGLFVSRTPVYPHAELFQDPTHLSAWTMQSMDYFCGAYPVARQVYGIKACFEKLAVSEDGFYLHARLRKPEQQIPAVARTQSPAV